LFTIVKEQTLLQRMREEPLKATSRYLRNIVPIMFKLGPRAISRHYRAIALHYSLAGRDQAGKDRGLPSIVQRAVWKG
jgi:hypothetical protein